MKNEKENKTVTLQAALGDNIGEVCLQWDSVKGADSYIVQFSSNGSKKRNWRIYDIVQHSWCTVTGLKPKRKYYFRIAPVSRRGKGKWSMEINRKLN